MVIDPSYRGFVEELADQRFSEEANLRMQWLMDRNNFGELTDVEREELKALVNLSEWMSLVRAQALIMLGRSPVASAH